MLSRIPLSSWRKHSANGWNFHSRALDFLIDVLTECRRSLHEVRKDSDRERLCPTNVGKLEIACALSSPEQAILAAGPAPSGILPQSQRAKLCAEWRGERAVRAVLKSGG